MDKTTAMEDKIVAKGKKMDSPRFLEGDSDTQSGIDTLAKVAEVGAKY